MLQGISLKKKVREKKEKHRVTKLFQARPNSFIFKRYFYTLSYTQREMKDARSHKVSPNIPAVLPLSKPGFFCIPFPQKMLCTVSSGLGGLWTFYYSLLIKASQPQNLFSLKVFFLYISNLCQPQKMPNRVTFFTEQRCSELQERTNQLKSLVWLNSRLHLFFLHSHHVN